MPALFSAKPLSSARGGFPFFASVAVLMMIGCGPSSPRFVSDDTPAKEPAAAKKGNIRFSSKVVEEETKEDDRKVDVKKVEQRFSSSAAAPKTTTPKKGTPGVPTVSAGAFDQQKMMDRILEWMGAPYEYGGETKSGIDCSAFTREMFRSTAGIDLPRTTEQQVQRGSPVPQSDLKFGDLIFFNTTGQNPSHVGIYIGDDMFAHASVSFGVTLSSLYSSYYKKRYTEARRIIQ